MAPTSRKPLEGKIREALQGARGRSLTATIAELNPTLRDRAVYFRLTETKRALARDRGRAQAQTALHSRAAVETPLILAPST